MPITCSYCQKNYSEKVVRCPFCNTVGTHAPPPGTIQPSLTPLGAAAAQDPELKKQMMLAAVQMKSDFPTEFSHADKFSLSNLTGGMRAAIVLWLLAALSLAGGALFLLISLGEKANRMESLVTAGGMFFGSLVYAGLGYGAWRGVILCVWIGAGLILLGILLGGVAGIFISLMIFAALIKFGLQMKDEQE